MDEGSEEYQILDHVWEVISKEAVASMDTIPASFGCKTPNIHTEAHLFTAEDWSFWLVHSFSKDAFDVQSTINTS